MRPLPAALAALVATGFTFMVLEVLFLRELQITLGGTLYASSAMLASVMLGLFLGSQLFGRLSRRAKDPAALFLRLELALAVSAALTLPLLRALGTVEPWPLRFALSFAAILAPSVLAGGEIPVALQFLEPSIPRGQTGFYGGLVYGADTLGGLVGALAVPFVLLPGLGALRSAWLAAGIECAGALCLWAGARGRRPGSAAASAAILFAAFALAGKGAALDLRTAEWAVASNVPGLRLGLLHDSPYQRIELLGDLSRAASDEDPKVLRLDGVVQAAVPFHAAYRESLLVGYLSHPSPERVLVIGCGDGDQIAILLRDPRIRRLLQVELDGAVVRAARKHLSAAAAVGGIHYWEDARFELRLGDGRQFLRDTGERFDVIVADLPHAAHEGAAAFYSVEFLRLARERLRPGGLFITHVYRPDEDAPGGRRRLLAALAVAGRTAVEEFPEVRLSSPWLRTPADAQAWPAHWLFASDRPIGLTLSAARARLGELRPALRWLTLERYAIAAASLVDPKGYVGWPVSTDDRPAILFADRWSSLEPARSAP
ncbi:MAG: fused MFS/spermidine synthase [Elusimicrobia bacterium]|nr:fused MFS/spermidine synthase [Elusimicrobiota bacterium]